MRNSLSTARSLVKDAAEPCDEVPRNCVGRPSQFVRLVPNRLIAFLPEVILDPVGRRPDPFVDAVFVGPGGLSSRV